MIQWAGTTERKKSQYFERNLGIVLIPGNIRKVTVKFLEFVSLSFQTIFEESHLCFKVETQQLACGIKQ